MAEDQTASAPTINLGSAIGEKLTESIKNMDVLSMIKGMVDSQPEGEESGEVRKKLLGVLEKYNSMSDAEKLEFTAQMKEALASKLSMKLKDPGALNLGGLDDEIRKAIMYKLLLVGAGVVIFIILLVFFGYKLYKSIKEKEKKREEKKKAKQLKKKK